MSGHANGLLAFPVSGRDSRTPRLEKWQQTEVVASEVDEGLALHHVGVKPNGASHHPRLLRAGRNEVNMDRDGFRWSLVQDGGGMTEARRRVRAVELTAA